MSLFSKNLEHLFYTKRRSDGNQFTEVEIEAASINAGFSITKAYIQRLRSGESNNPSFDKILALADFFEVHPGYFFDTHVEEDKSSKVNINLKPKVEDISMSTIAMRARQVNNEADFKTVLIDIANAIESIHQNIETTKDRKDIDQNDDESHET